MNQQYRELSLQPAPRPLTRKGWVIIAVVILTALTLLSGILAFFSSEGRSTVVGGVTTGDAGLFATIALRSVDAESEQAVVHVSFLPGGTDYVGDDGRMTQNTRILVLTSLGAQEVKFLKGDTIGRFDANVGLEGEAADYPFDQHIGEFQLIAETFDVALDGTVTTTGSIPIGVDGRGSVTGWNATMRLAKEPSSAPVSVLQFDRASSTQVFAILLLSLSVVIALMSIIVGVLVSTNRRRLEATMLSWGAALLFALPVLRNYLPNAPPIGASIDVYVYLWVIVAAVVGLVMLVLAWYRQQRATLLASRAEIDQTK